MNIHGFVSKLALMAAVGALCACKSNPDAGTAFCNAFTSQTTPVWTCTNCSPANLGKEVDQDLDTAAGITPNSGTTSDSATLKVGGALVASGATPGVFVTQSATLDSTTNTIKTYKNSVLQETSGPGNVIVHTSKGGTSAQGYIGMTTTKDFDTVEFDTANTWSSGTPVYYVFEICADGDVQ